MSKKDNPLQLVNPFSENFSPTWQLWKDFRKEEHNFQYKGLISEQMALKRLVEVSEGFEDKAIRIVEQSISRGWMDFYQLKQPSNNGKSKQSTSKADKSGTGNLRDRVQAAYVSRNGKREQDGGESHLKAV